MKLSVLFFNDIHGYLQPHPELFYSGSEEVIKIAGGYARIAGYINDVRRQQENVLVFDGGDTFHGTFPVVQSKGEVVVPILNNIGIDAMVGHWDFAYGPQHLRHLSSQLNYPVLGMNVYNEAGSLFLPAYVIKEVNGYKIAVLGICSNIIDKTMPKHFSKGLRITDGSKELPEMINRVRNEGANLVILLSHNGFPQDCDLLSKVNGVDICLSAHTHNRLYETITVNDTVVIQCGCHGSFIGHLDVEIESNTINSYRYELKVVDETLPQDEETERMVKDALAPHADLFTDVVGTTPVTLHRYNTLHSSMDNLLLAAMMRVSQTELAFSNGWRYGIPILKGNISKNDLFNIIPHNPFISTTELTGEEIKEMLEENLERTFSANPMQQMGGYVKRCMGLTAYIKVENRKDYRIQELFIGNSPYQKDKRYRASFVTEQGVPEKFGFNRQQTEITAVEAMALFLNETGLDINMLHQKSFVPV
ncbi:bifunctional metallophosphatase/5'-nucleotidase [Hydrobacter penzbergensis]|nr:5'-nucleotidase C-terminal domain-containing protein [Hydrobacter penzbergensis]